MVLTCFSSNEIKHKKIFHYTEFVPYTQSQLINISNNNAFLVGGYFLNYTIEKGCCDVYRIHYEKKENDNIGILHCENLKNTKFQHKLEALIYSKSHNRIFVLSGSNTVKCEYGQLNNEKTDILQWTEIQHNRYPRQNCTSCLLNDRFIFLIGGQTPSNYINEYFYNYEVYDINEINDIYTKVQPNGWKQYNLEINFVNKELFFTPFSGLITNNNNLYILGGYNEKLKSFHNFKIDFLKFCDERHKTDTFKINTVSLIKNKKINNKNIFYKFLGQQIFIKKDQDFFNVNGQGKGIIINKMDLE